MPAEKEALGIRQLSPVPNCEVAPSSDAEIVATRLWTQSPGFRPADSTRGYSHSLPSGDTGAELAAEAWSHP